MQRPAGNVAAPNRGAWLIQASSISIIKHPINTQKAKLVLALFMTSDSLSGRVALITGASRGIGASAAQRLAELGADIVINYRSKGPRAEAAANAVRDRGREVLLAQADLTIEAEVTQMMGAVQQRFGRLDILVLNASGGLEKGKSEDYAMDLNHAAQVRALDLAIPLMPHGSRVVFVTSHWAHFYGRKPVYPAYEPVAKSKHAGEEALRSRIPELAERGIALIVVSGDMIEGTITPRLLERQVPGMMEGRRQQIGALPTVDEFSLEIAKAAANNSLESGHTVFVGSTEWESDMVRTE
jgi:NAD(P)-dependent dehydrogenase (short-subunit alcohol dehydrogenase family)